MSERHLEGACEKLGKIAPMSSSGPGSPTGHLWALQHVENENSISLLPRNHERNPRRHSHATPVRDMSVPQGQGNGGDLLYCVPNRRNLKSSTRKSY